jgi:hypothetical protein
MEIFLISAPAFSTSSRTARISESCLDWLESCSGIERDILCSVDIVTCKSLWFFSSWAKTFVYVCERRVLMTNMLIAWLSRKLEKDQPVGYRQRELKVLNKATYLLYRFLAIILS